MEENRNSKVVVIPAEPDKSFEEVEEGRRKIKILDSYIANEPYVQEKVWEKIEIGPINVVIANGLK